MFMLEAKPYRVLTVPLHYHSRQGQKSMYHMSFAYCAILFLRNDILETERLQQVGYSHVGIYERVIQT